jgi:FixJ family two-component response regulator
LERIAEAIQIDQENRRQRALREQFQARVALLSGREHEVMNFLVRGDSSKQIAHRLSISPKTVDNHPGKDPGKDASGQYHTTGAYGGAPAGFQSLPVIRCADAGLIV